MARPEIDISIVIPAYREAKRIGKTLDALADFLQNDPSMQKKNVEVLVVAADAGDDTAEITRRKQDNFKNLAIITPGPRVGKGRDVKVGMLQARGNVVMFMDADLATPLRHLHALLVMHQRGHHVVIATRNLRQHHANILRRWLSYSGNLLFKLIGGVWVEDSQCGFKLFSRHAARACFSRLTITGWGFDMEVLAIAKAHGYRIASHRINDWQSVPDGTFTQNAIANALISLRDLGRILLNRLSGRYAPESDGSVGA